MVKIGKLAFKPYISSETVQKAIGEIAEKINSEYSKSDKKPLFLVTLTGALYFAADLTRKLDFEPVIGFVKCSSYGDGMTSTGNVVMKIEPTIDVKGKDVIVLEDILDTGLTWKVLKSHLYGLGAERVRIASMFEKKNPEGIHADWKGMDADNSFIIGMGLDYMEEGRNLPDIYILDPSHETV